MHGQLSKLRIGHLKSYVIRYKQSTGLINEPGGIDAKKTFEAVRSDLGPRNRNPVDGRLAAGKATESIADPIMVSLGVLLPLHRTVKSSA